MSEPGLPQAESKGFLAAIREVVLVGLGRLGDPRDAFLRIRDLENANIIIPGSAFLKNRTGPRVSGIGFAVAEPYEIDLTPPPTPTGLNVTAGISKLVIECDPPLYPQGHGHDRTIVYGATYSGAGPLPTFSSAVEITQFPGTVTDYATNPATEWHIWIKWRTKDGVLSVAPAGGTNGFTVATGQDVRLLLDALTAAAEDPLSPYSKYAVRAGLFYVSSDTGPTDAPLFAVVTAPITVGGVVVPVGVYMADAFIMNGTITNVKVANAAIDDLKVANVSVSKLIAGSIAVGQYAQSTGYIAGSAGWRINGDGFAEFSDVVVRGTVYAGAGLIGGATIGAHYIRSNNYVLTTQGWNFNDDGTGQIGGFIVDQDHIRSSNYSLGTAGWKLTKAGAIEAGDITLFGGTIKNSSDSFHLDMNATGTGLVLRAGPLTNYGSLAGNHYPVEIRADGSGFFGRGIVAGGTVKASGTYTIPDAQRPAVLFYTPAAAPSYTDAGGGP